ncbi:U4/U6-U5 snRNP complex subunit lsm8 [Orobanche gracilis]
MFPTPMGTSTVLNILHLDLEEFVHADQMLNPLASNQETISIITNDGRNIVGVLKGFDQATNIILDESHERVYSTKEGVQQLVLGLYIIRGDNISIVGELDEELDASLDLSKLRAHPLKPVIH